jgi:hypothetical protein
MEAPSISSMAQGAKAPTSCTEDLMTDSPKRRAVADEPSAVALLDEVRVAGASISTMGGILGTETVSASDSRIARIDELQFDLGEGPCWDALASGRPVLEPDFAGAPRHVWPVFSPAARDQRIAALYAFPMIVGPFRIGAIDLYDDAPGDLDEASYARTVELAATTGRSVLRRAIQRARPDTDDLFGPHSRRVIHQATGFVIAQLGVPVDEAELLIQASAFAENKPMREIAEEIVRRERRFTAEGGSIEETP